MRSRGIQILQICAICETLAVRGVPEGNCEVRRRTESVSMGEGMHMWFVRKKNPTYDITIRKSEANRYIQEHYVAPPPPRPLVDAQPGGIQYSLRDSGFYEMDLDEVLEKRRQVSFFKMIEQRLFLMGMSGKAFYVAAGLDRKLYSDMKTRGDQYQPSKDTAVRSCFALRMNVNEAEELMKAAGYAFSTSSKKDLAFMFCLEHEIWEISEVAEVLEAVGFRF